MEPLQGKIDYIGQEQQVSEKFRKREFAIEVPDGSYTQYIKFEITQDKCDLLDKFKVGQDVAVSYNIKGNKFPSKKTGEIMYFTSLQAWRIESVAQGTDNAAAGGYGPNTGAVDFIRDDADNDLPF